MSTRRQFLKWAGLTAAAALPLASMKAARAEAAPSKPRPNVLIILSDDQGWGDLSSNGNSNLSTPRIDALGKAGATFDRFYVCPVCSPTRAEFLTGRYHLRSGVVSTSTGGERMALGEATIAETFRAGGYATGLFGKWHNGMQWPYHPMARGFQEFYGFCSGHWGDYFDAQFLDHNGQLLPHGTGYLIDDLTDRAMAFIETNKGRPFFCYVPYCSPHSPMQVPDRFYAKFANADLAMRHTEPKAEDLPHTRAALAMCENIDWNVGRLLDCLDRLRLADNTIVLYFSDNGPNGWRWNGGMKGRKGSVDEGGVRSPLRVRWPGRVAAGTTIPQIAAAIDLLPTLADCAGIPVAAPRSLDGISLKPLLAGGAKDWPDRMIFSHWSGKCSVRTQRWRLDATGALYDMQADPSQKTDVASQHPEIVERLSKALAQWKKDMGEKKAFADRPFTVGYPEMPLTQLPARDGRPHGNVKRSAGAPNSSYFTNWTSPEDRITWDVDVHTAGRYEAVVYYTCPPADVGSTVELSLGDGRVQATVAEPHDPPARGAEHDRSPRGSESYIKDFKPLPLGTIDLKAGRGELTLRALKVSGKQVMEVRMVLLTLLA